MKIVGFSFCFLSIIGFPGIESLVLETWCGKYLAIVIKQNSLSLCVSFCLIALKFGRRLGSTAANVPATCQSDARIETTDLAASNVNEILR